MKKFVYSIDRSFVSCIRCCIQSKPRDSNRCLPTHMMRMNALIWRRCT